MSDFQWNDGSGGIFANDKGDNPARPDVRGEAMIDGKLRRISGWWKEGKRGKWLNVKFDSAIKDHTNRPYDDMSQQLSAPAPEGTGSVKAGEGQPIPPITTATGEVLHTEGTVPPQSSQGKPFDDDIPF